MKKTLLYLIVGVSSFYLGIFVQSLLLREQVKVIVASIEKKSLPQIEPKRKNGPEIEYSPSPESAYFPVNKKGIEKDLALYLSSFENKTNAEIIIGKKIYRTKMLVFDSKTVAFKSIKANGIEYSFSGKFLKNPFKEWVEDGKVQMTGILQKTITGKTIYKSRKNFVYDSEVCAWLYTEFEEVN